MRMNWKLDDIAPQTGKIAIVTGGNSGIGYHTVLELARKDATVLMAVRSMERGLAAVAQIKREIPSAKVIPEQLDLSDLSSVKAFASRFLAQYPVLDILVNNAGVMAVPTRKATKDGFELQVGTNHLGHFALTGLLLPALQKAKDPRIVTVSSMAAGSVRNLDDYMSEKGYKPMVAYGKSKLSNLYFAFELARKLQDTHIRSIAVHPFISSTQLFTPDKTGYARWMAAVIQALAIPAIRGALPTVFAATDEQARSGALYAPTLFAAKTRPVSEVRPIGVSADKEAAAELWTLSEKLTGVSFGLK